MTRRDLLWFGALVVALTEAILVYLVMPLPGSQHLESVGLAHALYSVRWALRGIGWVLILMGLLALGPRGLRGARGVAAGFALFAAAAVSWAANARMSAEAMFRPVAALEMQPRERNTVGLDRLVVGVVRDGEARAYPLRFIGYHHQLQDTVGTTPVLVTYCTVCRTGRVYSPVVDGRHEVFRLVGMSHWNAMLEDRTTGSWWRQATGKAVAGSRTGSTLREIPSQQVTLAEWLVEHPRSLIMQADPRYLDRYPADLAFERGESRASLTGTDTTSWGEKSWVIGVTVSGESIAFDWNELRRTRIINAEVGGLPIVLVLSRDRSSFWAHERPTRSALTLVGDSLDAGGGSRYGLNGVGATSRLRAVPASQEFWHSWRDFQPGTKRFSAGRNASSS